jgi:hypothetical protein
MLMILLFKLRSGLKDRIVKKNRKREMTGESVVEEEFHKLKITEVFHLKANRKSGLMTFSRKLHPYMTKSNWKENKLSSIRPKFLWKDAFSSLRK